MNLGCFIVDFNYKIDVKVLINYIKIFLFMEEVDIKNFDIRYGRFIVIIFMIFFIYGSWYFFDEMKYI